jgi:FtsP/CotA-like multicopper oxidase with cupredoxin domain
MSHVSRSRLKAIDNAARNRRELVAAGFTRKELLRMGLLTAGGMLVAKSGLSARAALAGGGPGDGPISPPTTPFKVPLPIPGQIDMRSEAASPITALSPGPQAAPNTAAGEGRTRAHQSFDRFRPKVGAVVTQRLGQHSFHPELPLQTVSGYDGVFPGPTFLARYGQPALVRMINQLPPLEQRLVEGFGRSETSCHLHNSHTPSESDGYPTDFFGPGQFYDHHYPNIPAGGDEREKMSTLWYHDHREGFTAQNVYKGMAGFYLLYDEQDTGDESTGFHLPGGQFDVPLLLTDKVFDQDGKVFFDLFNLDGILGDKLTVNGAIQPFFAVHPRKYRFRLLNAGPSRFYQLSLLDLDQPATPLPFTQISADGNLLRAPLTMDNVRLSVAERVDLIIDFSQFKPGQKIYLENRLEQKNGRGPTGKLFPAGRGDQLMRFEVTLPAVADASRIPTRLRELPEVNLGEVAATRVWRFDRRNGAWTINGKFFDEEEVRASVKKNSAEIWVFQNASAGWQHPVHVHFEEFLILSRNGRAVGVNDFRKDIARLEFNEEIRVFMRFRDFEGRYPMHCHNVVHEDHDMMTNWEVGQGGPEPTSAPPKRVTTPLPPLVKPGSTA